jgi:two-component system, OmpR family, sensor kinase
VKRWWRRQTLRFRLVLWCALGGAVLIGAFSTTIYLYVRHSLALPVDHELRQELEIVRKKLNVGASGQVSWEGRPITASENWLKTNPWFELWNENNELLGRFWPFEEKKLERIPTAPLRGRETVSFFRIGPNLRLRVLSAPLKVDTKGNDTGPMVRILQVHQSREGALNALALIIVAALPVVVALLVFGGYAITRRWLRPLDNLIIEAKRISAEDLSRRLSGANPHDEMGRLVTVFNNTLARLEDSFAALDQFVANASHELRTPLTTLRSVGEVGLRRSRTESEYREIIASMLEEAQRLQGVVRRLLQLAQAESGAESVNRHPVQLDEIVQESVALLAVLAENKGQELKFQTSPVTASTDPVIFQQALHNVIENAIKYAPANSVIAVSIDTIDSVCRVNVADDGPGIAPEHRAQITKRFFRGDASRSSTQPGFGLGLAITKAYMRVLGGSLEYEAKQPNGSIFRLLLPA